jgi:hypothetical protein
MEVLSQMEDTQHVISDTLSHYSKRRNMTKWHTFDHFLECISGCRHSSNSLTISWWQCLKDKCSVSKCYIFRYFAWWSCDWIASRPPMYWVKNESTHLKYHRKSTNRPKIRDKRSILKNIYEKRQKWKKSQYNLVDERNLSEKKVITLFYRFFLEQRIASIDQIELQRIQYPRKDRVGENSEKHNA